VIGPRARMGVGIRIFSHRVVLSESRLIPAQA
jgi:hypothetical protein